MSPDVLVDNRGVNTQNLFAYCANNPVNNIDPFGAFTVGLFINGNITFGLGISIALGIVLDSNGVLDIQFSYSLPKSKNTAYVGAIDAGVGMALQITNAKSVNDLLDIGTCIGASGGAGFYGGMDVISLSEPTDSSSDIDGIQINVGYGIGVDVHIAQTDTISLTKRQSKKITYAEIRRYTIMENKMFGVL